jgi:anti-sigma B factor antagonist
MTYSLATDKDLLLVTLAGDLVGGFETERLYREVDEAIEGGHKRCVVDLSGVRFLNSTGIGLLMTLLAKFRNRGGDLAIMRPAEQLKKLLIITKLEAIFQSVEHPDEAFSKLIVE